MKHLSKDHRLDDGKGHNKGMRCSSEATGRFSTQRLILHSRLKCMLPQSALF